MVSDGHKNNMDIWTLDLACSYHHIPNRSWFATYTKTKEGNVTLGDDHPCNVFGIGTIKMRMFDGMVITLTNMKHVLELKKNLVSLGYLRRNGYNFSSHSKSGVLTITKGAMVVIRGRRLENNLCKMEGSMVSGGSETTVAAQEQQDIYHL